MCAAIFFHVVVLAEPLKWDGEDLSPITNVEFAVSDNGLVSKEAAWTNEYANLNRQAGQTVHFRLGIQNSSKKNETLWFGVLFPAIKILTVHSATQSWYTGDAKPFKTRPILYPDYYFPIHLDAGEFQTITGSMQGETLRFNFVMALPQYVLKEQGENELRDMFFFGVMTTLFVCCLLLFFATKEISYLSFAIFNFSFAFLFFRLLGYGFQHLWPASPHINDLTYIVTLYMLVIAFGWMVNTMLARQSGPAKYSRVMNAMVVSLGLCGVFSGVFAPLNLTLVLPLYWVIAVFLLGLIMVAGEIRQGSGRALWFALALAPLLLGGSIIVLPALNWIPQNTSTLTITMGGIALSSFLFAIVISFYLFQLLENQKNIIKQNLHEQVEHAVELELQVAQRTAELTEMNEKLGRLALLDPLTNLANRRRIDLFVDDIDKQQSFCIAIFDLDHFKNINDIYGHDVGDMVLRKVGEILCEFNDEKALVGRFGGEEFSFISQDDSEDNFERLLINAHLAIGQLKFEELSELGVSASVGWTSHKKGDSISKSFRRADKALYHAKEIGRNQLVYFGYDEKKHL